MSGKKASQIGRPVLHGGFSTRPPGELLRGRARKRLRMYLTRFRIQLVEDLGGEEKLSAAQVCLIDRCLSKVTLCRMIELFILQAGPWKGAGELQPVLDKYLRFSDSIRADLALLGIEKRSAETILTFDEVAKKYETKNRTTLTQDGRSQGQAAADHGGDVQVQAEVQGGQRPENVEGPVGAGQEEAEDE